MKNKGFTLVELAVTVMIIVILMSVSVPIYRSNLTRYKQAEGYALLATIRSAQERYYAEYGEFLQSAQASGGQLQYTSRHTFYTANEEVLGINARTNKYFTCFCVSGGDGKNGSSVVQNFNNYGDRGFHFRALARGSGGVMFLDYNITRGVTIDSY